MDGAGQDGGWRHNTRGWEGNCHEADYYAGGALGAAGWKPARATPGYFSQMVLVGSDGNNGLAVFGHGNVVALVPLFPCVASLDTAQSETSCSAVHLQG